MTDEKELVEVRQQLDTLAKARLDAEAKHDADLAALLRAHAKEEFGMKVRQKAARATLKKAAQEEAAGLAKDSNKLRRRLATLEGQAAMDRAKAQTQEPAPNEPEA